MPSPHYLDDPALSFKPKGLLAYALARTDGVPLTAADLVRAGPSGLSSIRAGLRELQERGYLTRRRPRNPVTGHFRPPILIVRATPLPGVAPAPETIVSPKKVSAPDIENPLVGNTASDPGSAVRDLGSVMCDSPSAVPNSQAASRDLIADRCQDPDRWRAALVTVLKTFELAKKAAAPEFENLHAVDRHEAATKQKAASVKEAAS